MKNETKKREKIIKHLEKREKIKMPEKKVEKEKQTFLKEIILLFVIKYL